MTPVAPEGGRSLTYGYEALGRQTGYYSDTVWNCCYLDPIVGAAKRSGTVVAGYCLMPNHVHFLMIPSHGDGLRQTFAEAHRRYTAVINARNRWTGHLWQGRFSSAVMDGRHFLAAIGYVALNPVRAGLGRPVGASEWIAALEASTARELAPARRGPKPKPETVDAVGDLFQTVSP